MKIIWINTKPFFVVVVFRQHSQVSCPRIHFWRKCFISPNSHLWSRYALSVTRIMDKSIGFSTLLKTALRTECSPVRNLSHFSKSATLHSCFQYNQQQERWQPLPGCWGTLCLSWYLTWWLLKWIFDLLFSLNTLKKNASFEDNSPHVVFCFSFGPISTAQSFFVA